MSRYAQAPLITSIDCLDHLRHLQVLRRSLDHALSVCLGGVECPRSLPPGVAIPSAHSQGSNDCESCPHNP